MFFFPSFLGSEGAAEAERKSILRQGERPKEGCSAMAMSESSARVLTLTKLSPSLSLIAYNMGSV